MARQFAPLRYWQGTPARLLAGRLAMQLGAPRLGQRLHLVAWRQAPAHLEAIYYFTRYLLERFGPVSAWRFARQQQDWSVASPELQADWWALLAFVVARFRDWDRAERWLHRAEQLAPEHPWPLVERAGVYELAERYEEGLEATQRALTLRPWYRPAVQAAAHLLLRMGRSTEALDLLLASQQHLECGLIAAQTAIIHYELEQYDAALQALEQYEALSPLLEPQSQQWLLARRVDILLRLGRVTEALPLTRQVREDFYQALGERLSAWTVATPPRRLQLLKTHRWPGLTAEQFLAQWWKHPVPQPLREPTPLVPDGLPSITTRLRWQQGGWIVREFRLTAEAAIQLLERDVPFFIHLVEAGFNHFRLVVGMDLLRNTLLLGEADEPYLMEAPLQNLLQRQAAFGPRASVVVPQGEAARLDGVNLPDAEVYDRLADLQKALHDHDRTAAVMLLKQLGRDYPDHPLILFAELALAHYDAHPVRLLRCYDQLLQRHPQEVTWVLGKVAVLRELQRGEEREALLHQASQWPQAEPVVLLNLAQTLLSQVTERDRAAWLLRRVLRARPQAPSAHTLFLLATLLWETQRFDEALDYFRLACTLDEREDQFAEAYARTALVQQQTADALRLFQNKGPRASVPQATATKALYFLLLDRGEPQHARLALDQAIRKLTEQWVKEQQASQGGTTEPPAPSYPLTGHTTASHSADPVVAASEAAIVSNKASEPVQVASSAAKRTKVQETLGELLLFRAELYAASRQFEAAYQDLGSARPHVYTTRWLRVAARVAYCQSDFAAVVRHLQELTRLQPFDLEAQRNLLMALQETEGRAAVRSRLLQLCQLYPHHYPFLKLRVEFFAADPDADVLQAIQALLDECSEDAWAWRQWAWQLTERKQFCQAEAAVEQAGRLEPGHREYYAVSSHLLKRMDRVEEAIRTLRCALQQNIDQELLINELLQLSRSQDEKRAALDFIVQQLRQQSHNGEGLVAYFQQAHQVIAAHTLPDPDEHLQLLETLQGLLDRRPDLWVAWSLVIHQLMGLARLEEAEVYAREAVARFPLVGRLWLDLAQVCQGLHKREESVEALRGAFRAAPGWPAAVQALAEAYKQQGEHQEAIQVWELAGPRLPLEGAAHGMWAATLWEAGQSTEALQRLEYALQLDPHFDLGWQWLSQWTEQLQQADRAVAFARELTRLRPGNPEVWIRLARLLTQPSDHEEALASLERALTLDPRRVEAYDLKAERLAEMGRYDEAIAAAQPPLLAGNLPLVLQGRLAWVEARRGNFAAAIPPMQALVAIEPTYLWGWRQLAEWYNATGQTALYLEATEELVRLQPEHPLHLALRGEARLKMQDRAGAKADLREALRLAPGFSQAAALLFDICLADDEIREARQALALLQEHLSGPESALRQLQLAVRLGDRESALQAFTEICEGPGQSPEPLHSALQELKKAGWENEGVQLLRQTWQGGGPFHPWVPLLWIDSAEGQAAEPAERLRAVDVLVKAYPKFVPGHEAKAEQLVQAGRYEEALAACQPADLKPEPPDLRACAAWIEAQRGRLQEAILRIRQLLTEYPQFSRGWHYLALWYKTTERYRECLEAAEQLVRLEPQHPWAYLHRGDARWHLGDLRGACQDYRRALELDPSSEAAAVQLIATLLADKEIDKAAEEYERLAERYDTPQVRLFGLQIACHRGQREDALTRFHALARDPETTLDILREAARSFDQQNWQQTLMAELKVIVDDPAVQPAAVALWAERLIPLGQQEKLIDMLPRWRLTHPAVIRAGLLALLRTLPQYGHPVRGLITHYADLLRADTEAWAIAGQALAATGQYAHAAAWLTDWRTRPGLTPAMLRPLAVAYRLLGQHDRAADVCHAALQLPAAPAELLDFRAWAALDAVLARRTDEAAQHLARLQADGIPDELLPLAHLTRAGLLVLSATPQDKSHALREARHLLRSVWPHHKKIPGLLHAYRHTVRLVASASDSVLSRLWALLLLVRSYLVR
ncbi:MAG: tetratricopeptide repeat protein [Gemmataceae bacterium]|nr:tetratricopeptide repeat protein [Gemmataceae bacterium]